MNTTIANRRAAYNGALIAAAGVFAYSLVVMLYAIIRSSAVILSIMPPQERSIILWTNGTSIAYAVTVFSLLMASISTIAGAIAGIILRNVLLWLNPHSHSGKAILLSSIVSLILLSILYLFLYALLKEKITFQYAATLLFWYIFPAVIFFITVLISGVKLNSSFIKRDNG